MSIEDQIEEAKALLIAGEDLRCAKSFRDAIDNFTSVINSPIEHGPERNLLLVHAYTARGAAYAEQGDQDEAIDDFSRAIHINPEYPLAYYNRAMAWEAKGNNDQALDDYSRLLKVDPSFADAKERHERTVAIRQNDD